MNEKQRNFVIIFIGAFSCGIIFSWMVEALTTGFGPVSKYCAPFAMLGIFCSSIMRMREQKKK